MSNNPDRKAADVSKSKKRKRKKTKVSSVESSETPKEALIKHAANKKIKFSDSDNEIESQNDPVPYTKEREVSFEEDKVPLKKQSDQSSSILQSKTNLIEATNFVEQKSHFETSPNKLVRTEDTPLKRSKEKSRNKKVFFEGENDSNDEEDVDDAGGFSTFRNISKSAQRQKAQELMEVRKTLPIFQHEDKITEYITRNQVTIIIGETGSGKSTQIPQFLIPINKKKIAVTQPRRVAAASLAARVSEEYGCTIGEEVGYQVRFSNVTSPKTKLNYLTDGMLIRELMIDPKLSKYSCIVIDEAHERTVLTDLILGFLKRLIVEKKRTDLKIVVMSATLNAELFSKFFDHAPILYIQGKMYPVSRHYLQDSSEDVVDSMVKCVVQLNMSEQEGDILCFLPGQEEIDNCVNVLNNIAPELPKEAPLIVPLPLYAALSPGQQMKIFEKLPARKRKIILATNIAETSITVSGVKYVIDSGLRKVKVWKHQLGLSSLLTTPISQASAKQRAGRAGRESPGKVFRLYSENLFNNKLPKQQESEILRNDIILPVLTLKKMGVDDLLNWSWLEHPGEESILSALSSLYALHALDNAGNITTLGMKMAVLPLPPALSAVLLSALDFGVLPDVVDIVSCLSVENLIRNVGGNGELRDEINERRRQYCPKGFYSGDLIALKEYFDHFNELHQMKRTMELKLWCKALFFSYKDFQNVLKVRKQLIDYMFATIKQDNTLSSQEKTIQVRNLRLQLERGTEEDKEEGFEGPQRVLDVEKIIKSFLKGYALNTAIGMPDRSFRTCSTGQLLNIHPSSNLFGRPNIDAVMYIEYVYTTKPYGRNCSKIELSWLQEIAPHLLGGSKFNIDEE